MTNAPLITDSHCHLDFPDFDGEHDALISRARAAGVTRMVTICTRLRLEPQVRALAEAHDGVFYAAGTHPMSVADEPTGSVDAAMADKLLHLFQSLNRLGATILIASHDQALAERSGARVLHLHKGGLYEAVA